MHSLFGMRAEKKKYQSGLKEGRFLNTGQIKYYSSKAAVKFIKVDECLCTYVLN